MTTSIVQDPTAAIAEAFRPAHEALLEADRLAHRIAGGENVEPPEISRICDAVKWDKQWLLDQVARHRLIHQALKHLEGEEAAHKRRAEIQAQEKKIHERLAEARSRAKAELKAIAPEYSRVIQAIRDAERARQRLRNDLLPDLARAEIDAMEDPLSDLVSQQRRCEATAQRMRVPIVADPLIANAQTTAKVREDYRKFIAAKNEDREENLAAVEQRRADLKAEAQVFCDRRDVLMAMYIGLPA